jgi:hypothetical protein
MFEKKGRNRNGQRGSNSCIDESRARVFLKKAVIKADFADLQI